MATNFPSSLDTSTQQPTIAASDEMDDSGKEHDVVHTNHSGAIIALETKLGSTDSNPSANAVLMGTGSGTSAWDTTPTLVDAVTITKEQASSGLTSLLTLKLTDTDNSQNLVTGDGPAIEFHIASDDSPTAFVGAKIGSEKRSDTDANESAGLVFMTTPNNGSPTRAMSILSNGYVVLGYNTTNGPKLYEGSNDDLMVDTGDGTCSLGPKSTSGNHIYTSLIRHYFGLSNAAEYVMATSAFYPYVDNHQDCGASSYRWDDIRATNGSIVTSDERDKTDVVDIDLGLSFIDSLRPVTYKWDDRSGYTGTRTHMGFIAQEVATALGNKATGRALWTNDEAGTDVDDMGNEVQTVERQGLRYTELLATLVKAVQELSARVTALEG